MVRVFADGNQKPEDMEKIKVYGTWTQVGGSTVKFLRAVGVAAADGNIIKGTVNDGVANTIGSKVNYTEINIKVHVPLNAVPGTKSWKMRLTGYYV